MVNSQGHFAWYELITTDVAGAKAFYTNVIGWGAQDASVPGATYMLFTAGRHRGQRGDGFARKRQKRWG